MSHKTIPTRKLGNDGPIVSAIGFGAMSFAMFYGTPDEGEAFETLTYAADRGITFWDTADIYAGSEATLGKWFEKTGRRSEIFLATKFGAREIVDTPPSGPTDKLSEEELRKLYRHAPNSKPSYIKKQIKNSLAALKTDYIDLYYQHRVDPEVPIEVVLETLRQYVESGQIRWLGLSECSAATLKRARAVKGIGEKVIVAQMEFSPFELGIEKSGFVDEINKAGMAVVAYSPLARGLVTGRFHSPADFDDGDLRKNLPRFSEENFPKNLELVDKIKAIADKYGATNSQVTLAWILAEHPNFVPIPGTRNAQRLEENAGGAELKLSKEDVNQIRAVVESADVQGDRYPANVAMPQGDCIPESEWKGE